MPFAKLHHRDPKSLPRRLSTIERAFELAASGECESVIAIEKRLNREDYDSVVENLAGMFTRAQLREILKDKHRRPGASPSSGEDSL